jgi:Cu+-exporting ATPase
MLLIVAVVIAAPLLIACGGAVPVEASFTVTGMTCESCSAAIIDTLSKIEGVEGATADHLTGSASAVFRPTEVSAEILASEIEGLGYTVTETTQRPLED